jgi:hypothetical protein
MSTVKLMDGVLHSTLELGQSPGPLLRVVSSLGHSRNRQSAVRLIRKSRTLSRMSRRLIHTFSSYMVMYSESPQVTAIVDR